MFEILASDRFEAWFAALPGAAAEEASLALDVAAELAPALDPVRGRRALLWFDGGPLPEGAYVLAKGERLVQLREVVRKGLESPEFQRRIAELEGREAEEAIAAVERVKHLLSGARWLEALGGASKLVLVLRSPEAWLLELIRSERAGIRGSAGRALEQPLPRQLAPDPVYLALLEALRHAGLGPRVLQPSESGLCELTVEAARPAFRIIYGMDLPRSRLIAIVGEALDRRYYGDSVRFAERYFREYLAREGELPADPPAAPSR